MMTENAPASAWWYEILVYHCKPPVSDLFIEESQFDGRGFEMIAYIETHFNPLGAFDSLGYFFNLIDIKKARDELIDTLMPQFLRIFASLKMEGISIDFTLQVGFMLRALWLGYQAVVQEFHLGQHSLTTASLQTVVDQCVSYDMDPWKGLVSCDGKLV
jgi:hypothetical protein